MRHARKLLAGLAAVAIVLAGSRAPADSVGSGASGA